MNNKIEIIQGDITTLQIDAIVNAANTSLLGGGGVDGAIHAAAGAGLLKECRDLNGCATGEAKITHGYSLPSKWVIHTVGPIWQGGDNNEDKLLSNCYTNSLKLAVKYNIKSIAFPAISTGIYGFPLERATKIAINCINNFLQNDNYIDKIYFVCHGKSTYDEYCKYL